MLIIFKRINQCHRIECAHAPAEGFCCLFRFALFSFIRCVHMNPHSRFTVKYQRNELIDIIIIIEMFRFLSNLNDLVEKTTKEENLAHKLFIKF